MDGMLDINEVVRRTGLTSRTLRFYESRGLVEATRTGSGRRLYGSRALERINQIVALKRAGLTLSQIGDALAKNPPDLAKLIGVQLGALAARQAEIEEAMKLLLSVSNRLRQGEVVDAETLCDMIRKGETVAESQKWKRELAVKIVGEERFRTGIQGIAAVLARLDPKEHRRKTTGLFARIEAALPLDVDSAQAAALYDEWLGLMQPFMGLASDSSLPVSSEASIQDSLGSVERWKREGEAPFFAKAFEFLFAMAQRRKRNSKQN